MRRHSFDFIAGHKIVKRSAKENYAVCSRLDFSSMLTLVILLIVFLVVCIQLLRTHRRAVNALPKHALLANHQDVKLAGEGSSRSVVDRDDNDREECSIPTTNSSTSQGDQPGQKRGPATGLAASSISTVASPASISSLGSSVVMKFSKLKVNTSSSRFESPAGASSEIPNASSCSATSSSTSSGPSVGLADRFATHRAASSLSPFSSPLSTPPTTPPPSPSPSPSPATYQTPAAYRGHVRPVLNDLDFTLYKKKTRTLTKSPKKSQTKAGGKMPAEGLNDVTVTTWFYKTTTESKLVNTPPDLTGHPDGLVLGDVYFDRAGDACRLWLWSLDMVGVAHWKQVPIGYQRGDGKHLIVTRKTFFPSWVTPSYYRQIGNGEASYLRDGAK
ncbi:hypothetical protein GSI_12592 [Ganoderma sinense ZZ0214-1]|uniref:Uncharacterized protein n=1 Tax=Ganoderma sinense ZZ0214-1 TaxID=1077348 RepID=A0A2G8RT69_9APHY|nr:hypothetical protein GSI_12592 [Ganoderma sinense ZZ0214-1]